MAGGGIKINNTKIIGGADGATFIPSVSENGDLSWSNNKGYNNPQTVNIKGKNGADGKDGKTGAKIVSQVFAGQDSEGGNIYKQTFDDGTEAYFTAPKGDKGEKGESGADYSEEINNIREDIEELSENVDRRYIETSNRLNSQKLDIQANTDKIENLTNILLYNEQVAIAEVSQAFTTRQTADGENIIDNQNIFPKKIAGSTQNCYSLVDFSSAKTTGGLTVTANNNTLTISGTTTYNYAVVFMLDITDLLEDGKTYNLYQSLPFTSIFSSGAFYMQVNATNASTSAITSIFSANSTGKNSFICDKTTYSSYVLSLQSGVVDSVGTINSTISFMFYEGEDEKPYQPYFKGLKNAYFEKVVSAGRNLIDFITPFAAPNPLRKPFSLAEGTYTLQVICDDYDGQKINVVAVEFLDENYNRVLPLNNGSNNGINSWSTFSITAEEAARTRYIHVYMNSETGADLFRKIIKLMLNHGTEALPYEPYTESELGFSLDEATELKEWDYILPQAQKIVRQTGFATSETGFTDDEIATYGETVVSADKLTLAYKLAEATEEDIVIPNNYTAYQGGLEKVVQGNTDNCEYGARCTLTNYYFVKVGGATNEQTE